MSDQTQMELALRYAVELMEDRLTVEAPLNRRGIHEHIDQLNALASRYADTAQIDCPLCGATIAQVSSATLSLALSQHVNWVCPKRPSFPWADATVAHARLLATSDARCMSLETEVATLTARCEALEQDRNDFRDEVHTLAKACTDTALERDALRVRCEGLTAERDSWRRVAERLEGEKVEAQTRCQHLEQAAKDYRELIDRIDGGHRGSIGSIDNVRMVTFGVDEIAHMRAALASLLPTQEEPTQTDENRVSFAAGYSQALDDQAKGLK